MVLKNLGLTGATGMLGRHLRTVMEKEGIDVTAVSRSSFSGSEAVNWDLADWLTMTELDDLFANVQAIIHTGAMVQTKDDIDQGYMFNTNIRSCVNLGLWAISRNIPLVHISSATVYAEHDSKCVSENAVLGYGELGGFYGFSKLLAEDVFKRLCQLGLKLSIVRPSSMYGYGLSDDKMISRFLATAKAGGTIHLRQPVHDRVDLIHATDVSYAILEILKKDAWDIFNIAFGRLVSIDELAETCLLASGQGSISIKDESSPRSPVSRFSLDTSWAQKVLDWQPVIELKKGLTMMILNSSSPESVIK